MNTDTFHDRSLLDDHTANGTIRTLARLGYLAKGVVYTVVGILAASAVFGWFGIRDVSGTRGAIEAIASQPFGNFLLIALVVGLGGYVVWRFVQAFSDTEDKGTDATGIAQRIGFAISGLMYATLAYYAVTLTGWFSSGGSAGQGSSQQKELTASLMSSETGILIVGAIGIGFALVGLYQGYRSISKKFKENWKTSELSADEEKFATRLAQIGIGVRAVTFVIIGGLITKAAMDVDPSKAEGLGEALRTIGSQPFGQWLLAAVAFGLVCYGIYCFVNSRYRAMTL